MLFKLAFAYCIVLLISSNLFLFKEPNLLFRNILFFSFLFPVSTYSLINRISLSLRDSPGMSQKNISWFVMSKIKKWEINILENLICIEDGQSSPTTWLLDWR